MKRNKVVLAGLATLVVAVYVASQLAAQTPATAPVTAAVAPPSVKFGLVNLAYILKNYNKYKSYSDEMEKIKLTYEKVDTDLRKKMKECQDYATRPGANQDDRDKMEGYIKTYKRQQEDNANEFKSVAGKKSDAHMVQCYDEIEEATKRFATANGFHMIFSYSEALTDSERKTAADVGRKITGTFNTGCIVPLYMVNGLDVSADVVNTLNTMYPVPVSTPATAPVPGGGKQN